MNYENRNRHKKKDHQERITELAHIYVTVGAHVFNILFYRSAAMGKKAVAN